LVYNSSKSDEKAARKTLFSNMSAVCNIYADGERVAQTASKPLQWPDFQVEFTEQF
jgi:hypothetical protein